MLILSELSEFATSQMEQVWEQRPNLLASPDDLASSFHVSPQHSVQRAVLTFTSSTYMFISLRNIWRSKAGSYIASQSVSLLLDYSVLLRNFWHLLMTHHFCFILELGKDEVELNKGSWGAEGGWSTSIWFRGLLAIPTFRNASTKVLAIQGNFGDSNRQSFLRAQVESQVQKWGGILLHPAARGMLEFLRLAVPDVGLFRHGNVLPRISCCSFKQLNLPLKFLATPGSSPWEGTE